MGNYENNPDVSFAEKGLPHFIRLWIKNRNQVRVEEAKNPPAGGGFRKWMRPPAFKVRNNRARIERDNKGKTKSKVQEDQMRRLETEAEYANGKDSDHGSTDINMSNPLVEKFIKEYEAGTVGETV
jgi:hypothetical protein